MADGLKINMVGLEETARLLERFPDKVERLLGGALFRKAAKIMARSKIDFVPVDLGALRNSGHVDLPETKGGEVSVSLGFGDPAAPYALFVHENLQASHKVGGPKFLEIPFREEASTLDRDLAQDIRGRLF